MRHFYLLIFLSLLFPYIVLSQTDIVLSQTEPSVNRVEKGNVLLENIPEIPQHIQDRLYQYQHVRSAALHGWHPAGKGLFITTRFAETSQVHWVEKPGGARTQLTFFKEPVSGLAVCPNATAACFIFSKDEGGGENYQLHLFDLHHRESKRITDGESRNGGVKWSNDGSRFAYHSTKRNQKDYDIYIANAEQADQAEMVLQTKGLWTPIDWSPDDKKLLLKQYVSIQESYLYILDLSTKELVHLLPSDEKVSYISAKWSTDGKSLYFISNQNTEFQELRRFDVESNVVTSLTSMIPWDITRFEISNNGMYLAYVSNENGVSKLRLVMLNNTQEIGSLPLPSGVIQSLEFSPDNQKMAFTINTPTSPSDVHVIDIPKFDHFEQWTFSEVGELNSGYFVKPKLISYPTFDQIGNASRTIPAFYFKPPLQSDLPYPVLVYIHGGPESQYRPTFNAQFQYMLHELGIAVIAPNVRGSRGYGKSYLRLDNGKLREDSVRDIGALLDWIKLQPELDQSRVIVMGGSYGGYMTLASLVHYSERLLAGIEIVGISNFVTFLENTKEYRRDLRRAEYGDERITEMRDFFDQISPTHNVDKIKKPVLIAQGLNDPRVPAGESEQMVKAIREQGTEVWYFLAKDEGHGFRKKSNRDFYDQVVFTFIHNVLQNNQTKP